MFRIFTDPNKRGLWVLLIVIAALVLLVFWLAGDARADTPPGDRSGAEAFRVERAISHLVRKFPAVRVARDPMWRKELAGHITEAANANELPPLLVTAIVYRESSFKPKVTGDLGERGLMQVHGHAARGCDLETPLGQLECGSAWLAHCRDRCGSLDGGFALYASGRTCKPRSKRLKWTVKDRWKLWAKLEKL